MALIVNTNIVNDTNQYLLDAKNVKGTYVVVASVVDRDALPMATMMKGTLCYCQTEAKLYQYTGNDGTNTSTSWAEANLGGGGGGGGADLSNYYTKDEVEDYVANQILNGEW
jgi:hypothetical protein